MEKKQTKRTQGQMRVYVEENGDLFPFSMTTAQFEQYSKSKSAQQKSKSKPQKS